MVGDYFLGVFLFIKFIVFRFGEGFCLDLERDFVLFVVIISVMKLYFCNNKFIK